MNFEKTAFVSIVSIILISVISSAMSSTFDPSKYVEMNVLRVYETKILFGNNCTGIMATTTADRSQDLELGQQGLVENRPVMSDTFAETLKNFNITLEAVLIERADDDYFYSDMVLRTDDKVFRLDSKPSDAIAVALRTKSPVYINKTLLEEHGSDICPE